MRFRRDKAQEPEALAMSSNTKARNDKSLDDDNSREAQDQDVGVQLNDRTRTREAFEYPTGLKLALLISSVMVSMFLVSLDRLIISTAIPAITDEFSSLQDVGWYGSAYLLTTCAFQLLFGKLYSFYPVRAVFMTTILLFEIGSAVCGSAPNSMAFIIGRAIQGVGSAGIFSGAIVVIVYAVPLNKRPVYQGMFGAIFGISSVIGPLVGGAFTSNVTWRWCFYINIPIGAVALVIIGLLLRVPDREETKLPLKSKLAQLDAPGTAVLMPAVVCLLLALQWGGLTYSWNNGRIIALLTVGILLLICFVLIQCLMPKTATIAPRIFKQRSILAGFWSTVCIGSQMMIFVYYLPIWFQAIKGASAVESGIRLLPITLSMVLASIPNGFLVAKIGYYTPSMIVGSCLTTIGAGLLTTLQLDTGIGKWLGYQVIYGFGVGMCFQAPNLAAQTVLPTKDVPIGTSLMFFSQILGGAVFTSVGQNVLNNQLLQRLSGFPGFEPSMIENSGATTLTDGLPADLIQPVLEAYNESLRTVFRVGLCLAALTTLGAVSLEFRSVKKKQPGTDVTADAENGEANGEDGKVDADANTKSDGETLAGEAADHEKQLPVSQPEERAKDNAVDAESVTGKKP